MRLPCRHSSQEHRQVNLTNSRSDLASKLKLIKDKFNAEIVYDV